MDQIRTAAKWMVTAAAAVGAILVGGSQLSSLGELDPGIRLYLALLGIAASVLALAAMIWAATKFLLPVGVTLDELAAAWDEPDTKRADVRFFRSSPGQLGYPSPAALIAARKDAWDNSFGADAEAAATSRAEYGRLDEISRVALLTAQYQLLRQRFDRSAGKVLLAALVTAAGVVLFTWAANPPDSSPAEVSLRSANLTGADLRDADLGGVDLRRANLSGSDLTGADLSGAWVDGVTWTGATCPDGSASAKNGNSCRGHLKP